jgi:protein arginine N-methyltransferase 1
MGDYSVADYAGMTGDRARMIAYGDALRRAVSPGSIVVDVGAGAGVMTLLACRAGARHVFAIEPNDAIEMARELVRANGMADRVTFFQALSTDVTLPERADVIVADLRGSLPLLGHHFAAIADARERLLAPGGTLLPQRDDLRVAPVRDPELHKKVTRPWIEELDLEWGPLIDRLGNTTSRDTVRPSSLLAPAATWATIDYGEVRDSTVRGSARFTLDATSAVHGLALWFDATIDARATYSNAPGRADSVYGNLFLPLRDALVLTAGETLEVELRAVLVRDTYHFDWTVRARGPDGAPRAETRQATIFAATVPRHKLARRSERHVPVLGPEGRFVREALERMDGSRTLEVIARDLVARHPRRFPTYERALSFVADWSARWSEGPA